MLRKVAEVPTLSRSLFLSTMGVSYCNPLNRTRSAGWFRVERIALPQQRCRKAKWVERDLVLRGPSLVEALLPSTCVTVGREGATRGFVYSSAKQDQTGSSDRFASGSLPATFSSGEGCNTGFKNGRHRDGRVLMATLAIPALENHFKLIYLSYKSCCHSRALGSPLPHPWQMAVQPPLGPPVTGQWPPTRGVASFRML